MPLLFFFLQNSSFLKKIFTIIFKLFVLAVFVISSLLYSGTLHAQLTKKFTLVVKSSSGLGDYIKVGEAYFLEGYRSAILNCDSAYYENGIYSITGELLYPTGVRIFGKKDGVVFNELIFIEPGYQEMIFNILGGGVNYIIRPDSKIEKEYKGFLRFSKIENSESEISAEKFKAYIKQNPASYIALFFLIDQTFNYDFKPYMQELASLMHEKLLNTKGFQFYEQEYLTKKKMPVLNLYDANGNDIQIVFGQDGRFTLIEFWFNGCKGCLPLMKKIKNEFYAKWLSSVRVISVGVDNKSNVHKGKAILDKMKIPWDCVWDYEAKQFSKYVLLYMYPSNLLIDRNSNIVAKNIDLSELSLFVHGSKK